jgi:hypothetical protein
VIRLLADQNFNARIIAGLRRREPLLDLTHVRDIGLASADDRAILAAAAAAGRVLLTHEFHTMPSYAYERVAGGEAMAGVFLVNNALAIGQAIDELLLAIHCLTPGECGDIVRYFPM